MTPAGIVIDADTGVDDALAIVLAAHSPGQSVAAITAVAGNAEVGECARNALLLAEALWPGKTPIVSEGASTPLDVPLTTAPEVHGDDGLGGSRGSLRPPRMIRAKAPAHELLLDLANMAPAELVLVATGPLTNLALVHREHPDALALFRRIVVMGGAFAVPGNTGPVAEFNFYVDPLAADTVLGLGLDVTVVPLDVTTSVCVARDELDELPAWSESLDAEPGTLPAIIARALDHYIRYQFSESGLNAGYMHDPVAMCAALAPGLIGTREMAVRVALDGPDRGRSVEANDGRPPVRVAVNADATAIRALIRERVLEPLFG